MAEYGSFHCTTIGYSHIVKNTCCEDYSASLDEGNVHIAVISDGHGDKACFRSSVGSKLAVEIAVENLRSFARNIQEQGWENRLFQEKEQKRLLRQLARSIIGNWNLKIFQNLAENPITDEEFAMSGSYTDAYRRGEELAHVYGCTLIAALMTDRYLVVLHQGDGRCVVIHQDGTADQPVPWDDRCEGNVCTSLCHEDAVESCRFYVVDLKKDQVVGCFVTSDGIEDSLEDQEEVNAFFCNVTSLYAQYGARELEQQLEDYLPKMSRNGSADDMSVAGIVDMVGAAPLAEPLSLVYELHVCKAEERHAASRVSSMQRKHEHLKKLMQEAQEEYDQLVNKRLENNTLMERLRQELLKVTTYHNDSANWVADAEQKLEEARKEFTEYDASRNEFQAKAQAAHEQADRLLARLAALQASAPVTAPAPDSGEGEVDWEYPNEIPWDNTVSDAGEPAAVTVEENIRTAPEEEIAESAAEAAEPPAESKEEEPAAAEEIPAPAAEEPAEETEIPAAEEETSEPG